MYILLAGAGKVGRYLAQNLSENNQVGCVDFDEENISKLAGVKSVMPFKGDATDPRKLEEAGILKASLMAAVTGKDETNLVVAQLAKQVYNVPRVISRVNNPSNQWLFNKQWGVDVAINSSQIMLQLITEETSLGEVLTLLKLKVGQLSLVEVTVPGSSLARGREVQDLGLPENAVVVAILRNSVTVVPKGNTVIGVNDSLLIVMKPENEQRIRSIFAA